jgi:hypothetical protein
VKLVLCLEVPKGEEDVVRQLVEGKYEHSLVDYLRTEAYNRNTPAAHVVDRGDDWAGQMRSMLGRKVRTTYAENPGRSQVGELMAFSEDGEVAIREETGVIYYCWPNLHTELVEEPYR